MFQRLVITALLAGMTERINTLAAESEEGG